MKSITRKACMKMVWLIMACVFVLTSCMGAGDIGSITEDKEEEIPQEAPVPEILVSNTVLWPGEFFSVIIKAAEGQDEIRIITALSQTEPVFYPYQAGKMALVGVNCRTKEGKYPYTIQVLRNEKVVAHKDIVMDIMLKQFSEQRLKVSGAQKEQRSEENLNDDRVHVERAKALSAGEPLWEGVFVLPVMGRISTDFGMIRYVNGEETGRHTALDISAKTGTPVAASNNGIVRLAMMLKVTGNTVIIDHGCGIFSAYCHLDKIKVVEGANIEKGEILGEVGSTGFSTGPHLHWTVSAGPVYIDPSYLMSRDPMEFIRKSFGDSPVL